MRKRISVILFTFFLTLGVFNVTYGHRSDLTDFNTRYNTAATVLNACVLCHLDPGGGGPKNPYGDAYLNSGFAAIENLDSDIDGFRNIVEITERTFPGDASSYPSFRVLILKYYNDILRRGPEPGGAESWTAEMDRIVSLGIDVKEGFIALGKVFFNSPEYVSMGKSDTAYVLDLYQAFLNRTPTQPEVDSWLAYLTQGVSRNEVLNFFIFSAEFNTYMAGIFGAGAEEPENSLINDFYRGILGRLPDTAGFNYWLVLMRAAQCAGAQQVRDLSHQIASLFVSSAEYVARGRMNSQYVEDLYDAILRRGAAPNEITYWLNILSGGTMTREEVLLFFTNSPEFQIRVQAVIDAGCL